MDNQVNTTLALAEWLLARETQKTGSSDAGEAGLFRTCKEFEGLLVPLVGVVGFRVLVTRTLSLAQKGAPCLAALRVNQVGRLERLPDSKTWCDVKETEQAGAMMLARLLGLLFEFIGEALTLQLVRDVWPDAPFEVIQSAMRNDK